MKPKGLDRRRLLIGLSALAGGALLPSSEGILSRALAADEVTTEGGTLSGGQKTCISIIADIIIPETDTAGALGADVPAFIDMALTSWLSAEERMSFLSGLDAFIGMNAGFIGSNAEAQKSTVQSLDEALWDADHFSGFYRKLKEMTLIGYYTSEVGASVELAYDPVPGPYHEFKLSASGRSWST
ncbi:gluconate 2-dehydrogenase subunit 3 family protein [Kordiimonas sp.]|uniref:gluconate 2-dehydrogenase subunit 3 family protein n=1 Tax=Kordiimonas sp. TaxID=1970157 RepID=UPI003A8CC9C1